MSFIINRIVASCEAVKFKSNLIPKKGLHNIVLHFKDSHYLQKGGGYQCLSTILHSWLVGVASSWSYNSFFKMRICRSLFMRILHPASISDTPGPSQQKTQNVAGSQYSWTKQLYIEAFWSKLQKLKPLLKSYWVAISRLTLQKRSNSVRSTKNHQKSIRLKQTSFMPSQCEKSSTVWATRQKVNEAKKRRLNRMLKLCKPTNFTVARRKKFWRLQKTKTVFSLYFFRVSVCVLINVHFFCLLKVSDLILYKCSQCWTKIYYAPYLLQSCKTGTGYNMV